MGSKKESNSKNEKGEKNGSDKSKVKTKNGNKDGDIKKEDDKDEQAIVHCYCRKTERNFALVELLCVVCSKWYHESCIGYQLGKLVPFMLNYTFTCKNCSPTGLEVFKKQQATFSNMSVTTLANLTLQSKKDGENKRMFSKDEDIVPYIDNHWESITTLSRKTSLAWHNTILRALVKDTGTLFVQEEVTIEGETPTKQVLYGLKNQDLGAIRPHYEAISAPKGRAAKRKHPEWTPAGAKKTRGEAAPTKMSAHGYPMEHPFNKDGYRYILAEPDPHAPFRKEFDESQDWAGKPIPGWLYRALTFNSVILTLHDMAPQLKITDCRKSVTGSKGYCMVRASHGVNLGSWYFEVTVKELGENSAVRIGWSQQSANLQAPLGYDKFGYSWRSRKGTRFHQSRGAHYSTGYGAGDTLGFLITLPKIQSRSLGKYLPPTYKDKPLVKFKNHLYYEEKDEAASLSTHLKESPGSSVTFYKNGVSQGTAYTDIYRGTYYPTVSLYKNPTLVTNYGPSLKYPPKDCKDYKTMSERIDELHVEQTLADLIYLVVNKGKLRLDRF